MRRLMFILILLGTYSTAAGQARITVNSTEALIGDQLTLNLELTIPPGMTWQNDDLVPADTIQAIQILSQGEPRMSGRTVQKSWQFAVYDTGYVRMPPLMIILQQGPGADTVFSNDIPLRISGVTDSTGMAPIKTIIYEPVTFEDYLPYILGALGLVVVGGFLYWWSNRPRKAVVEEVIVVERPPHELALEELEALQQANLWQAGHVKEYHSKLNIILRRYLEKRYEVATLESTTREVSLMLKPILTDEQYSDMMQMLELEDLIKFAKARPPEDIHQRYLDFVRQFVVSTALEPSNDGDDA